MAAPESDRLFFADKFEEGMSKGGQTRTHALLAYAFGVRSVVVAITQLDNLEVPYSRKRYETCQGEVLRYLKRVGFVQDRVSCVPVSGLCGDNISEVSGNLSWYVSSWVQLRAAIVLGRFRRNCPSFVRTSIVAGSPRSLVNPADRGSPLHKHWSMNIRCVVFMSLRCQA